MKTLENLACAIAGICSLLSPTAHSESMEEMVITGIREQRDSKGATGLNLSVFDTPQSVSVIGADTVNKFALGDINSLLEMATGVNVEKVETDRTYYNARGFDITSMHVDGVGAPFSDYIEGSIDTGLYQKVEIIRGANGLITGIGNPSGTVNYVRKRPTNERMASARATLGSWNQKRLEVDASVPLSSDSRWAARGIAIYEDTDSWLDLHQKSRKVFYGIVDGQLGSSITLAAGYTHHDSQSDGILWGALPLMYNDGTQAEYEPSTTVSMKWTYWDATSDSAFAELGWQISNNWSFSSTYTYTETEEPTQLFYLYLGEQGFDPETGLGLNSSPAKYDGSRELQQLDASLDGTFTSWGQQHDVTIGASMAQNKAKTLGHEALTGFEAMPAFPGWSGDEVAEPEWADPTVRAGTTVNLDRFYTALRLSVTNALNVILGTNMVNYESEGDAWGVDTTAEESSNSPYVGFTWEIIESLNAYASYSDIYNPQYELAVNMQPLGAAKGSSYEGGLKKHWLDDLLLTSFAIFRTEQENLAEFAYRDEQSQIALYRGITAESNGYELEVVGALTDTVNMQLGYTQLELKDPDGEQSRTFIPRDTLKLLAQWQPRSRLEFGLSARWQSDIYNGPIKQDSYLVVGGYARYAILDTLNLTLNLRNMTDEHYLTSLQWEQAYYGEPRAAGVSLSWRI